MKIATLNDVFLQGLADISNAEKQIVKALPKFARAARNEQLTECFETHEKATEGQIARIEQIVENLTFKLPRLKSMAIEVLIEESNKMIREIKLGAVRDVLLITGAQKIEHYEIAGYSGLMEIAKKLGLKEAVQLLTESLREEKAMDERLNKLAASQINGEALKVAA